MRFLLCNGIRVRLVMLGLVVSMIFGLFGCGSSGSRPTPDSAVRQYLENSYGGSYELGPLTKKEDGPFMSDYYSGYAHETDRPLERFTVWVSSDCAVVKDARYTVAMLPTINGWVQAQADAVWTGAAVTVVVDALTNAGGPYSPEDFREFYRQETVNNTVLLVLPERTGLVEQVMRFQDALDDMMTGYIRIYITDSHDMEALFAETPDAQIMIGSPESVVREKLEGL